MLDQMTIFDIRCYLFTLAIHVNTILNSLMPPFRLKKSEHLTASIAGADPKGGIRGPFPPPPPSPNIEILVYTCTQMKPQATQL